MRKSFWLLVLIVFAIGFAPSDANFVQCLGGGCAGAEGVTENADVINGTSINDDINGLGGDDVIFAGADDDIIFGEDDNDLLFAGTGSDEANSGNGDDTLLLGPDVLGTGQRAFGGAGNDTTIVMVGDVSECLIIDDGGGTDVATLVGIGPYSAPKPFGQPGFDDGWIWVVDPIAGGDILIDVTEATDIGIEIVHGLPSPNANIVPDDHPAVVDCFAIITN